MNQEKRKLLVIEDDPGLQKQLRWSFDAYEVLVAADRESALSQVRRHEPGRYHHGSRAFPRSRWGFRRGLATLEQNTRACTGYQAEVSSYGNQDHGNALKAIGLGAYDFHPKPFDSNMLSLVVERAFYVYALQQENRRLLQTQAYSLITGIVPATLHCSRYAAASKRWRHPTQP